MKRLFKSVKSITIESKLSVEQFNIIFEQLYSSDKKPGFEGWIDENEFKLTCSKKFSSTVRFSDLYGSISEINSGIQIEGTVKISPDITFLVVLGVIVIPIMIIYMIYSGNFEIEYLGIFSLILLTSIPFILLVLYINKREYIRELMNMGNNASEDDQLIQ